MEQMGFFVDLDRCMGCKACEIACKQRNHLDAPGPRQRIVRVTEEGAFPATVVNNVSLSCMHCAEPECVANCPVGALSKGEEDGVVRCDVNLCIGCKTCSQVCPFDVPQYREDGTNAKCDMCSDRRQMGLQPACVTTCFNKAIKCAPLSECEAMAEGRERIQLDPAEVEVSVVIVR